MRDNPAQSRGVLLSASVGTSAKPGHGRKEGSELLTLIESGLLSSLVAKAELRELLDELYDDFDD